MEVSDQGVVKPMETGKPHAGQFELGGVEKSTAGTGMRMRKDAEINELMADGAPKEGEEGGEGCGSSAAAAAC